MDVGALMKRQISYTRPGQAAVYKSWGGRQWDEWVGRKPAAPALKPEHESDSVGLRH